MPTPLCGVGATLSRQLRDTTLVLVATSFRAARAGLKPGATPELGDYAATTFLDAELWLN